MAIIADGRVELMPSSSANSSGIQTISVAIMNMHFLGDMNRDVKDCTLNDGRLLPCYFYDNPTNDQIEQAQGHWYHTPTFQGFWAERTKKPEKHLRIAFSMESAHYYPNLENAEYMSAFDIEMSYRLSADIVTHFFSDLPSFYAPPRIPFNKKTSAAVYLNRNCGALSGRDDIIKRLMDLGVPVHAYGNCLYNQQGQAKIEDKFQLFSKYKLCIAIENSNARDYVTEKLWQAFDAGCLPVYGGPPNPEDFLPSMDSIVWIPHDYTAPGALERAADDIKRLLKDEQYYNGRMRWRSLPNEKRTIGWQRLVELTKKPSTECQLCKLIAHRMYQLI
jgi:hypothetical protein